MHYRAENNLTPTQHNNTAQSRNAQSTKQI